MSFWSMGGYASFIWPAYGVSVLGIGGAIAWTLKTYADARARLAKLEKESRLKKLEEKKP
jgi:heme exporter protein CcmD